MNAVHAQERAAAAEALHRENHGAAQAAWFSAAAEQLATATLSWRTLPPTTRAELDAIGWHLEGLRRSIAEMRTAMQK